MTTRSVRMPVGGVTLDGDLAVPEGATGLVIFAHGSGSGRFSPRNRHVAEVLQEAGQATLLLDLLTPDEERIDERTRHLRFDVALLAERLSGAAAWAREQPELAKLPIGYFGASTGAAAALVAAGLEPDEVAAVVSRGGRPDLAGALLSEVVSPTLLLVGGEDTVVLALNREAMARMGRAHVELRVIPGATHLFEEAGTLEEVARHAAAWFGSHLAPTTASTGG